MYLIYAILILTLTLYALYGKLLPLYRRRCLSSAQGCMPPTSHFHLDPVFGFDELRSMVSAAKSKTYLDRIRELYHIHGNTYACNLAFSTSIHTIEPENIKAILTTQFRQFGMGDLRRQAFYPILGDSILITDGAPWEHSRALLRPSFARNQVGDIQRYEKHVMNLIAILPRNRETVDLKELFFRLTADTTTEILFGKSINSLSHPEAFGNQLATAFHQAQVGGEERWRLGKLAKFVPNKRFWQSLKMVNKFMDDQVEAAMQFRVEKSEDNEKTKKEEESQSERYVFSRELAKLTDNKKILRDELITIFYAGRDTTAGLLTNLFFVLARRPDIWKRTREEVAFLEGEIPTFKQLGMVVFIKNCINESLRLHPVLPTNSRIAFYDTTLPVGGGPDGKSPIFVAKGTMVTFEVAALHRRQDLWGDDASEFRPERWETENGGSKFLPFSTGPRNCIGQNFALTEAIYTTVRLAQKIKKIESRDPEPWREALGVTCFSANGAKVALELA